MIHKHTLQFKDKQLESKYQQYYLNNTRYPLFKHLIIGLVIAGSVRLLQMIFVNNTNQWMTYLFLLLSVLGMWGFVYFKRQYIRLALVIMNHLIILSSLDEDEQCSPHYYFLKGASMMSLHLIILMAGEILESYFSAISITSIRLFLILRQDHIVPYSQVLIAILIIGYLQYTIYKNNLAIRCQFQLSYLDNQWDEIITQLIDEPYLLIDFDENLLTFSHKKSRSFQFNCESHYELKFFLRNILTQEGISLEKYYYSLLQGCIFRGKSSILKQKLYGNFKNIDITIEYSIFFGIQPMILLQILKLGEEQLTKPNQLKIEKLYEFKYKKFLSQSLQRFKSIIKKHSDQSLILSSYKQIFYLLLIEYCHLLSKQAIHRFNIRKVFRKLKFLYTNKLYVESNIRFQVVGNKNLLSLLLIKVFESSSSNFVKVRAIIDNQFYEIIIEGNFTIKASFTLNTFIQNYKEFLQDHQIQQSQVKIKFYNYINIEKIPQANPIIIQNSVLGNSQKSFQDL